MVHADDLMLYADVVKLRSFTKAANKHGITAASVSKRISQLEKVLGVRLLNRTTRQFHVTEAGGILFTHCENFYINYEKAVNAVIDSSESLSGDIKILAPVNFSNHILAPIFSEFINNHSSIKVTLRLDDTRAFPALGEYDIIIRTGFLDDSLMWTRKIAEVTPIACASPAYLNKHGVPKHPDDLREHNCIDFNFKHIGGIWPFLSDEERFNVPITSYNVETNSPNMIKELAKNGVGMCYLPNFIVQADLDAGSLVRILPKYRTLQIPVSILLPYKTDYQSRKIQVFIDYLSKKLKELTTV